MARITVEDCLQQVDNRFALIHLAAKRVRELRKGDEPQVKCKNEDIVTALREIAEGKVQQMKTPPEDQLPEGDPDLGSLELPELKLDELTAGESEALPEAPSSNEEADEPKPEAAGKEP